MKPIGAAEVTAMPLEALLARLEETSLVRRMGESEPAFAFKHTLAQETAYQSLLLKRRREIHGLVAACLEEIYGDRLDEYAGLLAAHYAEAGNAAKTLEFARRAGDLAAGMYANDEAICQYTSAIEAAQRLATPAAKQILPALYRGRGLVYETRGQFEQALHDHQAALAAAEANQDRMAEWQAHLDLGLVWSGRDYVRTGEHYQKAYELAQAAGQPEMLGDSLNRLGNWHVNLDQPVQAQHYHQQALDILRAAGDQRGVAYTLDFLAMSDALGSNLPAALQHGREAIALLRELGDRQRLASTLSLLGIVGVAFQSSTAWAPEVSVADSIRYAEEGLALAQATGWRPGESFGLMTIAWASGPSGEFARALQAGQDALQLAEEISHRQWMAGSHCAIGTLYCEILCYEPAVEHLEQGLRLAVEIGSDHWQHLATGSLASACVGQGMLEEAARLLEGAGDTVARFDTLGGRLMQRARIELYLARGEPERALAVIDRLVETAQGGGSGVSHRFPITGIPILALLRAAALAQLPAAGNRAEPTPAGRGTEIESLLRGALACTRARGDRSTGLRLSLALAQWLEREGQHEEAQLVAQEARALLAELAGHVPDPLRDQFVQGMMEQRWCST